MANRSFVLEPLNELCPWQRHPLTGKTVRQMLTELLETEYTFSDLRFGSTIPFVDAIQTRRSGKEAVFRIQARIAGNDRLEAVRFVTMPGAGGDTGWQPPTPD